MSLVKFAKTKPFFILIFPVIILIIQSTFFFLKNPPIWPDEAIYADIANNWLNEHRLGPNLWLDAYPGATEHFYSYPPLFLLIIATYFKFFGLSAETQRLISQTSAIAFLFVFFFLIKSFTPNRKVHPLLILPIISLVLDPFFSESSRISRPEMTVILISSFGFLAFIKAKKSPNLLTSNILIIVSGILASLAFLTHFLGGIIVVVSILLSFLFQEKLLLFKSKNFYLFILSFSIVPLFYFLSIIPSLEIFKYQLLLYSETVSKYYFFILSLIFTTDILPQFLIIAYIAISAVFIIKTIKSRDETFIPLAVILGVSWVTAIYAREVWYFVYLIPWVYLAAILLVEELLRNYFKLHKEKISRLLIVEGLAVIIGLMFLAGLFSTLKLTFSFWQDKYSYHLLVNRILDAVPNNKTVFLSSIPDPYYGFKSRGRNNTVFEFPVVDIGRENLLRLLDNSDYVIFTKVYNPFTNLLPSYIDKNAQKEILIGSENQYQTRVIELKPKDQRQKP